MSFSPVATSEDFPVKEILNIIGVKNEARVRSFNLNVSAGEPIYAVVELFVTQDQAKELAEVAAKQYIETIAERNDREEISEIAGLLRDSYTHEEAPAA